MALNDEPIIALSPKTHNWDLDESEESKKRFEIKLSKEMLKTFEKRFFSYVSLDKKFHAEIIDLIVLTDSSEEWNLLVFNSISSRFWLHNCEPLEAIASFRHRRSIKARNEIFHSRIVQSLKIFIDGCLIKFNSTSFGCWMNEGLE